ncbi:MAG: nucleotide sugar dehydrogenase [Candidatus Omnitrophota bacterium]|nr:MAG: nucleotide sugar dehydrogenase [Candidatus Omnitrophota bacterium]
MNYASKLKKLIDSKKAKICIIGLGYVGLPIALEFVKKGFFVYGLDNNKKRIGSLKKGNSYITDISSDRIRKILKSRRFLPTTEESILKQPDIIIICVPTPLRKRKIPNISYIIMAAKTIVRYLQKSQLIILESTTYPGTTRDVILPILKKSGLKESKDFFLSFSPERIDPGNRRYTFSKIPKIVGGISKKAAELTRVLYSKVIDKVIPVSLAETAEAVKLLENTFRIVNIGLINEFAMLCSKLNIDVWEVVEAAKTKPFGFMPFYPGPGIGGHCLPIDPLYLSWKARKVGFRTKMIDLAAKTNLFMPHYVVRRIEGLLNEKGKEVSGTKILILGVTYKKDVKDLRESPALDIIELLQGKGARVSYSDPYILYLDINSIRTKGVKLTQAILKKNDLVILVTDHREFNYKMIANSARLILDTRNAFERVGINAKNIVKL